MFLFFADWVAVSAGQMPFAIDSATRIIAERVESSSSGKAASRICCYQCGRIVAPDLLRSHVGEHILRALLGVEETNLQEKVCPRIFMHTSPSQPCSAIPGTSSLSMRLLRTNGLSDQFAQDKLVLSTSFPLLASAEVHARSCKETQQSYEVYQCSHSL